MLHYRQKANGSNTWYTGKAIQNQKEGSNGCPCSIVATMLSQPISLQTWPWLLLALQKLGGNQDEQEELIYGVEGTSGTARD